MKPKNQGPIDRIIPGIHCFAWNHNASKVAVCPGTKEILIFSTNGNDKISKWTLDQVCSEHYAEVSALDWHPRTDLLLSVSTDRAAIVWKENDKGKRLPQMCIVKEKKALLDGQWNYRGDKFVVGSSSGNVTQLTFDDKFSFWVARQIRSGHKDGVVCVRYDPGSSRVSASVSLDGTIKIETCYDEKWDGADQQATGPFKTLLTDGEIIFKYNPGSWINFFAFSPSSSQFVFGSHDSELQFFRVTPEAVAAKKLKPKIVQMNGNPVLHGDFVSENALVVSGYDKAPIVLVSDGQEWSQRGSLDEGINSEKKAAVGKDAFGGRQVFFDGLTLDKNVSIKITDTKHQNYINCQKPYLMGEDRIMVLSTSDPNGFMNYWPVGDL